MECPVRIEANGEPRLLRALTRPIDSPLGTADSLLYVRSCIPQGIDDREALAYAAFVRHVLADIRDLPDA